mgnify:CR=1 FL=1
MNILINAYAVSPTWGSEPDMGWNWISNLAAYANLYIITEGEWSNETDQAVNVHPHKEHLHFYYLPVSEKVRNMCWNQGDWRFYYYYKKWQKRALAKAQEIIQEVEIDVIHQLNMVGFREPGYMWELGKPLVWGPIGGLLSIPYRFLENASWRLRVQLYLKGIISTSQLIWSSRINRAFTSAQAIIAATPETQKRCLQYKHRKTVLIPETGCYDYMTVVQDKRQRGKFNILWVGRFIYTKRLDIALRAIAHIKDLPNLCFHVVGTGNDVATKQYQHIAQELGISDICEWHGKVENHKVHEMMREEDVFFFTSIAEATSTVIPEAINNGLPIVCFDTCGFGPLVTDKIGCKVQLSTPGQSILDFAGKLRYLYNNKQALYEMSLNCSNALKSLLWEDKARRVFEIYKQVSIG